MDIKSASAAARQMANFFKVFKDVEEVLEAAARCDSLKAEMDGQIASLQAQRANAEEELRNVKAHATKAKADYASTKARQEQEAQERLESLNRDIRERQEAAAKELGACAASLADAQKAHQEFVSQATAEKAALEQSVKALQKQLEGLKAKVASL